MTEKLARYECDGLELTIESGDLASVGEALTKLRAAIEQVWPSTEYWVAAGHDVSQPNTRIVEHRRLWASMGIAIAHFGGLTSREWRVEKDGNLRYFGVAKKSLVSDDALLGLWKHTRSCWLLASKYEQTAPDLSALLPDGWAPDSVGIPQEILKLVSQFEMLAIRNFGPGDAGSVGVIAVGQAKIVSILATSLA